MKSSPNELASLIQREMASFLSEKEEVSEEEVRDRLGLILFMEEVETPCPPLVRLGERGMICLHAFWEGRVVEMVAPL